MRSAISRLEVVSQLSGPTYQGPGQHLLLGLLAAIVHDPVNLLLLVLLHLNEALVDRVFDAHARHERLLPLADAENSTKGLLLRSLIPPWVDDDDLRSHSQIETETTAPKGSQKNRCLLAVVEHLDGLVARCQAELAVILEVLSANPLTVVSRPVTYLLRLPAFLLTDLGQNPDPGCSQYLF